MGNEKWTTGNIPDLTWKKIIVTGGNSGLGYEAVKAFAQRGAYVVMACRSTEKGELAKKRLLQNKTTGTIEVAKLDLADLKSVRAFALRYKKNNTTLDVLLNNAGIMTTPYFTTKDGFEGQIGTNHLGHFALTGLLMDCLKATPNSRVVTVSSLAHKQGKIDFNNLLFEGGKGYTPMKAYGRSKLANLLFTYELQRRLEAKRINTLALAAHPGVSNTNLFQHLEKSFIIKVVNPLLSLIKQPQEMGALPEIRAAVEPEAKGGNYYGPDGFMEMKGYPVTVQSNKASHDAIVAKRLWEWSEKLTGVFYP